VATFSPKTKKPPPTCEGGNCCEMSFHPVFCLTKITFSEFKLHQLKIKWV